MPEPELDPGVGRLARADAPSAPSWRGKRGQQVRRWLERRGRRAVRPPREPGRTPRSVDQPVRRPRANTAAARVEGERAPSGRRALVGLESAPMDALGRAGRVHGLTIQPRKKTHECYSKGNRRPAK